MKKLLAPEEIESYVRKIIDSLCILSKRKVMYLSNEQRWYYHQAARHILKTMGCDNWGASMVEKVHEIIRGDDPNKFERIKGLISDYNDGKFFR